MKAVWTAVVSAFSTFSILPAPRIGWDSYSLKNVLSALPLVGVVIGGFLCLYHWLSTLLDLSPILSAVVYTVLPIALSGGIHMDGFADSIDALSSHASPEKKRAILKDPHSGAFAALGIGCYLLAYFGLCAALPFDWKTVGLLSLTHVLSRAAGGLLSLLIPSSAQTGMQHAFRDSASKSAVWILCAWIVLALGGAAALSPLAAGLMLASGACVFFYIRHTAIKQFGGMSGDLAGFGISLCAAAMLLGILLSERAVSLWF